MHARDDGPPLRSRRRLLLGALALAIALTAAVSSVGRSQTDRGLVEQMLGDQPHGPVHLVVQEIVGGREWTAFAYIDADGRPCFVETLGGGGCHPYAGRVRGQIADYRAGGASWENDGGIAAEYVVVTGAVPPGIHTVTIEFDDGTAERVETHGPPGFDVRVFALLSEGDVDRNVVEVRSGD